VRFGLRYEFAASGGGGCCLFFRLITFEILLEFRYAGARIALPFWRAVSSSCAPEGSPTLGRCCGYGPLYVVFNVDSRDRIGEFHGLCRSAESVFTSSGYVSWHARLAGSSEYIGASDVDVILGIVA